MEATPDDLPFLPVMQTDIVLRGEGRQIIIDTKYYRKALRARFGHAKIRSEHLYQLDSYLTNAETPGGPALEGVLLYPAVGQEFCFKYTLRGRPVQVRTVNLARPWADIRRSLLELAA